jgi:hypothetical protein
MHKKIETMKVADKLKLRELVFLFVAGLGEYPNDKERLEKGLTIIEDYVDAITARECSAIVSGMAVIKHGGQIKN